MVVGPEGSSMSSTVTISASSSALPMEEHIGEDAVSSDGSMAVETQISFHNTTDELEDDDFKENLSSRPTVAVRNQAKKAKRVRFLRNGDRFFKGVVMPVAAER